MTVRKLASAAVRFPWALSVFGAQEILSAFKSDDSDKKTLTELYSVTEASQAQFETNPYLFGAYQVGKGMQHALVGAIDDVIGLRILDPEYLRGIGAGLADTSANAFGALASDRSRNLTLQITRNKLDVIATVNEIRTHLALPERGEIDLAEKIEKAHQLGEFPALFAVEGLAETYARNSIQEYGRPTGLLTQGQGANLPNWTLMMMHAGIGLTFAKHVIATLSPWDEPEKIDAGMKRLLSLNADNSRPGYIGPAIESLGLVAGTWHQQMVKPISESLARFDPDAREFFWHGVGRSMYFNPINMIPGFSPWKQSETDPPEDGAAKLNARAGLAWAFCAVNIRHPEITAYALRVNREEITQNDGFSNGVTSVLMLARDTTPESKYVAEYCGYRPDVTLDPGLATIWNEQLGSDLSDRVVKYMAGLHAAGKPGEIYRYHKLAEYTENSKGV